VPPRDVTGPARSREKPAPASVFGVLHRADAPITRAQKLAGNRVQRAQTQLPQQVLPAIPTLAHPTRQQARTAVELGNRAVARIPVAQRGELAQDPRSAARLAPVKRSQAVIEHNLAVHAGMVELHRNPGAYGIEPKQLAALHKAAVENRIPEATRAQIAQIGRGVAAGHRAQIKPGVHREISAAGATVDLTNVGNALSHATTLGTAELGPRKFLQHSIEDIGNLGTAPFVGGYQLGSAAVAAAKGDTRPIKALAKGTAHVLAQSAPAQLLTGHPVKAGEAFVRHPVLESLNFAGAAGVAGRTGGALARGLGTEGSALARAGSTVRSPIALTDEAGSRLLHQRTYSKDLIRRAVQVAADQRREPLRDTQGRIVTAEVGGRTVPVLRSSKTEFPVRSERQRLQDSAADFAASRANSLNRLVRERTGREADKPTGRRALGRTHRLDAEMVPFALEGTARTPESALADLRAHRAKLDVAHDRAQSELAQMRPKGVTRQTVFRHKVEMADNRERAALIDKFLASNPTPQRLERIFGARANLGPELNRGDLENAQAGIGNLHQMSRSRLFPYAQEHMGAKHFATETGGPALRHSDGRFMANAEIEAHMRASGVDPTHIAYLPHNANVVGRRAYYSQFRGGGRPTIPNQERTGELYARGATGVTRQTIRDQAVRQRTTLAKAQQVDRFVHDSAMVREDGKAFTPAEARETADRLAKDTGEEWVPVSMAPAKLEAEVRRAVQQGQDPAKLEGLAQKLLNSRVEAAKGSGTRNVGLVPARMLKRLDEHLAPSKGLQRVLEFINRPFRFAVLAQPRWIAGNFIEPMFVRLPAHGSGVFLPGLAMDLRAAHRIMKGADPKLADELQSELLGGLFIGQRGATNRRTVDDLPGVARYGAVIAKLPVAKQFAWLTKRVGTSIGHGFFAGNRVMEAQFQRAALGHLARQEVQQFTGSWIKAARMGDEAVAELRKGLVNTATQRRFAGEMDVLLGKYSRWSPSMRHLVQGAMPFVLWSLAAARFVWWTLPAHHSVKTAALVAASKVNQQAWDDAHANVPPGALKVAQVTKKGGLVDLARYTPYGFSVPLATGDYSGLADPLLPQFGGTIAAAQGKDPFGRDLTAPRTGSNPTGKPTSGQKAGIIANTLLEAFVPQLALARRIREGGGTGYSTSTALSPQVKPGSKHMSGVRRALDPFRPTYLKAPPATGGGHVKGSYWQRSAAATGAHSASAVPDESYWRSLAAGH
jgi:hypothetical protein